MRIQLSFLLSRAHCYCLPRAMDLPQGAANCERAELLLLSLEVLLEAQLDDLHSGSKPAAVRAGACC